MQRQTRDAAPHSQPQADADRQVGGGPPATRAPVAGQGFADQVARLAPGGSLDTALQANAKPSRCGPDEQRYANPEPFGWSVDYRKLGLGEGHFGKGKKQRIHVEASYDWATVNLSEGKPEVDLLGGKLTFVAREGRKEVERDTEDIEVNVEQNSARFDEKVRTAKVLALPRTKVRSRAPQRDAAAELERCP
ncbi:MAG: hypothetical protein CSA66_04265 [Proteobacteria bacterium]|nr:MAG: hypothetical protein CSA66_04265 [Pseudomonadota bacterium]